jgi:alpha-L-rhamnosidase
VLNSRSRQITWWALLRQKGRDAFHRLAIFCRGASECSGRGDESGGLGYLAPPNRTRHLVRCNSVVLLALGCVSLQWLGATETESDPAVWPAVTQQNRPWGYWWWMGSAVDQTNITRDLERYHAAGLGGVHIIPIYGARGFEDKFIQYLSPEWMRMLDHTVREAKRLGMGVDMTTGSGWCFGGPRVTDQDANASVLHEAFHIAGGQTFSKHFNTSGLQALMAFSDSGESLDLRSRVQSDGELNWSPERGVWDIYAISQKPSGQKVKRAGPGGQGQMLNLFSPEAMKNYLGWFDGAFCDYHGAGPRAMYHDSYEYRSDWSPDLLAQFEKRRGYKLTEQLPALFGAASTSEQLDRAARVKADYRQTISELMARETLPMWTKWSHEHGFITRNEAHGSPGNWLDLYAAADVPETEMFHKDRNKLVSKFASSAAHVTGRNLVAAETGTWLAEHFTETLADMKYLLDDMFLSGVNHVFYHGICYSPDEAGWPGWHFYASYEMNPRNSIWRDVRTLNEYAARCQAVLQAGRADNDLLLYWPIHDVWHDAKGLARQFTIHARDWFEDQPIGKAAEQLWSQGYGFDYISDDQIQHLTPAKPVVVPPTTHMPVETMTALVMAAKEGATVIFISALPQDVPGWGKLQERRAKLKQTIDGLSLSKAGKNLSVAKAGRGLVLVGDLEEALQRTGVQREEMFDLPGMMCVRRSLPDGFYYFVANRSATNAFDGWLPLGREAKAVAVLDPLSGQAGAAPVRQRSEHTISVRLKLLAGQSLLLRALDRNKTISGSFDQWQPAAPINTLKGQWNLSFLEGGPVLPGPVASDRLGSWTELKNPEAQRFAGTALYRLSFDAPAGAATNWRLDLGEVCQSARVRLNGRDYGTLIAPPFSVTVNNLKPASNLLEVEVTNVSANRIRDLDRRGVKWKTFYDINIVNLDYKPFDASTWPLTPSGLLGPVTLTPVSRVAAALN